MSDWIIFWCAAILIVSGIAVAAIAAFGLFRFRFALNRMHAAAMCDTLGIMLILLGLIAVSGFSFDSLKLALIILLLWCASPVSSHLLAYLEVTTSTKLEEYCEIEKDERGKDVKKV
ncbi:MAG: monovalent cation/H(+) antiporter subunit G [Lachnospiraceae bacterium]|nr:monovalent cation/H(+) antiporter subunit G [Lachnospiraceae bacterium]